MKKAWILAFVGALVLAVGCQGSPDNTFNGGAPVEVPSWYLEHGTVLRFPDGSTLVSRYDMDGNRSLVRKLAPDGAVATTWGTNGEVEVPFLDPSGPGARSGVVLADGSVVLLGGHGAYWESAVRITPTGVLDTSYGAAGELVVNDGYSGPYRDACVLLPDGSVACATGTDLTGIELQSFSPSGVALAPVSVPVDLTPFVGTAPPGTSQFVSSFVDDLAVDGDDVVVSVDTTLMWWDESSSGDSGTDSVVFRIHSGALDPTFGAGGFRVIDVEVDGTGHPVPAPGPDDVSVSELRIGADHAVTVVANAQDSVTFDNHAAVLRLTATGSLDTTFSADALAPVELPDGTPVELTDSTVLPTGVVTLAGSVPDGAGTRGVVIRLAATGLLDTGFSTDGVVDVAGTRVVHALDDRNGRVTVGASSSTIDNNTGAAPVIVQVLFG